MLNPKLKIEFENWKNSLTPNEKNALLKYTSDLYEDINYELRLNNVQNNKTNIELIESALMKYTLPEDINVFRYEGVEDLSTDEIIEAYSIAKKETYLYDNFLSTSISIEGANNFLSYLKQENKYIAYKFISATLCKGINCGFLDKELSYSHNEHELLLNKGCCFEYTDLIKIDELIVKFLGKISKL